MLAAICALVASSVAAHAQTAVDSLNRLTIDGDFTFTIGISERFANTPQQISRDGYTLELLKESADLYVKQKKMTQAQEDEQLKYFKLLPSVPAPSRNYTVIISGKK